MVPTVDLIVLGWNHCDLTRTCVSSILENTQHPNTLYLVDNASEDGTWAYMRSVKRAIPILNAENLGFAQAMNQAIEVSGGDLVCLINNDTTMPVGWLGPLVDALEADPQLAAVSPMSDLKRQSIWKGRYFPEWPDEIYMAPPMIPFTVALIPRAIWQEVGPFDLQFPIYGNDDDWCFRARALGYYVGVHTGVTIHHEGDATTGPAGQQVYREESRALMRAKWGEGHGY